MIWKIRKKSRLNSDKTWKNIENTEEKIVKWYGKCGRKVGWIVKWYGKYGRKTSRIVIRYGQYGRKASWIVKRYEKYGRKVSWIVKGYGNHGRKVSWIVKWFGKYGRSQLNSEKILKIQKKIVKNRENTEENSKKIGKIW